MLHQNIAGLLSKLDILKIALSDFVTKQTDIDIICISETFLKRGDESNVHINGYKIANFYSRAKQRRGGVCIMCKDYLICNKITWLEDIASELTFECCGVEFPQYKYILICIYRIPNSNPRIFLEKLEIILNKTRSKTKKKVVIVGDFNINTLKPSTVREDYLGLLQNFDMHVHVNKPTRGESCLDHILSNEPTAVGNVIPLGLSDHETCQTLSVTVNNKISPKQEWYVFRRDYSPEHILKFLECISSLSWAEVYEQVDVNNAFNLFHDTLILFFNLCFPMKKIKVNKKIKKQSWITKGLRLSFNTKRKLRYLYNCKSSRQFYKTKYRSYDRILKKSINLAQN